MPTEPHEPLLGTTSACAENTGGVPLPNAWTRNYLRVRGEYVGRERIHEVILELPPRARRILSRSALWVMSWGTTSACAENTIPNSLGIVSIGTTSACAENTRDGGTPRASDLNYLRVRGEYSVSALEGAETAELPPRARRIPFEQHFSVTVQGTTSACAENTRLSRTSACDGWNYLRVRGEYKIQRHAV